MTKITETRFEVSGESYGVLKHVKDFDTAVTVARHWIDEQKTPAQIFDRMARKGKPDTWRVTHCTGEAHSNPWIDHCSVCMPRWGVVVKVLNVRLPDTAGYPDGNEPTAAGHGHGF
jgi:hypothetical protein